MPTRPCVLIVDEDDTNAALLKRGFERSDYRMRRAHDQGEVLKVLDEPGGCAAIVVMRLSDGKERDLLKAVKSAHRHADIPVLLESPEDNPNEWKEVMGAGASACFVKPYDVNALVMAVAYAITCANVKRPADSEH